MTLGTNGRVDLRDNAANLFSTAKSDAERRNSSTFNVELSNTPGILASSDRINVTGTLTPMAALLI